MLYNQYYADVYKTNGTGFIQSGKIEYFANNGAIKTDLETELKGIIVKFNKHNIATTENIKNCSIIQGDFDYNFDLKFNKFTVKRYKKITGMFIYVEKVVVYCKTSAEMIELGKLCGYEAICLKELKGNYVYENATHETHIDDIVFF